jgi:phosphotransferase system enzyme I (PtsI)
VRITLLGNIEFPGEVAACLRRGAEGVGLYRTEFLFLNAATPPGEEEQFDAYAGVVRALGGRPVTIRTLDLGVDKLPAAAEAGPNPALGLRSLRLSLRDPAAFRAQLRAILRAAALGDVRIMFPFVTTIAEWRQARVLLDAVASDLEAEGVAARRVLPVGAMIEVPAAALMADRLAKEVDFFSIGTNDLIQYTLAVDRNDPSVATLYDAAEPAVLRLIDGVARAGARHGKDVAVCGAMGGDPLFTATLLGLGLRTFSMAPHHLPEIRRLVGVTRDEAARALAVEALELDTAEAVGSRLREALHRALDGPAPDVTGP